MSKLIMENSRSKKISAMTKNIKEKNHKKMNIFNQKKNEKC